MACGIFDLLLKQTVMKAPISLSREIDKTMLIETPRETKQKTMRKKSSYFCFQ